MPIAPLPNEPELLLRIAEGDQKSFSNVFTAYHDGLYQFVLHTCGDTDLAKDVLLDVFTNVWLSRKKLPLISSFTDWLFIVTRNQLLKSLQKKNRSQLKIVRLTDYPKQSAEDIIQDREYDLIIQKAIEQLPPKQQQAFRLSRQEGFDNKTIAKHMGVKPESVKKYLQWAQQSVMQYVRSNTGIITFIIFLQSLK